MKEWIAVVNFDQGNKPRPIVMQDDEMENPATFNSIADIRKLSKNHALREFCWLAVNFVTGQVEEI